MPENSQDDRQEEELLVVGLGASAGGLEALEAFFDAMPDKPGMAFVVIIHLSPDHKSSMAEIIQEHSSIPVMQVSEQTQLQSNHIYIIPPGKLLAVEDHKLVLSDVSKKDKKLTTIDLFFRSLGKAQGNHSACVILSGTGSDGSVGLKTIKENGGIVITQDPEEAAYNGMPYNAIQTGLVDLTLPVKEIPAKLIDYKESLNKIKITDTGELPEDDEKVLSKIFGKVNFKTSHDFTKYKRSSVLRRIERRMRVKRINTLSNYLQYITNNPPEIKELFKDLLISVTNFFRDPEAFEQLKKTAIPKIFKDKGPDDNVRVWVPGCATGEEAYSLAILLHEHAQTLEHPPSIQIFATDIDQEALKIARNGRYPESIAGDLTIKRLNQYFTQEGDEYQVKPNISSIILFAVHDLLKDPPFSKLDLISCRNLLIYLNQDLQSKVFNLFHYALKAEKWLFLGLSDSILKANDLFSPVDNHYQIYQQNTVSKSKLQLPNYPLSKENYQASSTTHTSKMGDREKLNIADLHHRLLFKQYEPASVIINKNYEVLHSTPDIDRFLKYSGGEPSQKILDMVLPELRKVLGRLLFQAKQDDAVLNSKKVQLDIDGSSNFYKVMIRKITEPHAPEGLLHIIFTEQTDTVSKTSKEFENIEAPSAEESDIITALEKELEYTKEQLHITIEEYETSNEELQASNEELQSMNEELRSTTEQLETSKEELQSVNEELKSVNTELENKIEKLNEANSNLKNLMESTDIATLFIDSSNSVQFFTSAATEIFNLIPSDTGRPFNHVTHNLDYQSIQDDIKQVKESLESIKKVVPGEDGRQYIMRLRPYRTINDKIDGVVLTLVDITQLKNAEEQLKKRAWRQKILSDLGIFALQEDDLQKVIGKAIEDICSTTNGDYCLVLESNKQENSFRLISSNLEEELQEKTFEIDEKYDAGYVLTLSEPLITEDYQDEKKYSKIPLLDNIDVTSGIHINIGGTVEDYGVVCLYTTTYQDYSKHELDFIQIIANIIGSAIERDRTAKELLDTNKQLQKEVKRSTELQKEILSNSLTERWSLGEYLHDNLAQILASIKILTNELKDDLSDTSKVDASSKLNKINELIDKEIDSIRNLSHDIIPIDVEQEGVSHAFNLLVRRSQQIHNIKCTLKTDGVLDQITNRELSTNLYHITQEAIKNAATHGEANRIIVTIKRANDNLLLQIKDDGTGFSPLETNTEGMGLRIMNHRVDLLGGTFTIDRLPDSDKFSTVVKCKFPTEHILKDK